MQINWSDEKNDILKRTRDVCFEDVELAISLNDILAIKPHYNAEKYPNQKLLIISIRDYTYYVPFVIDVDEIFLKNIIPSRKYHKIYSKKD
nr:toxin [uncultured Sulfurimonas sp.]